MPNFRRYYIPGALVFITGVTQGRVPRLNSADDVDLLLHTMRLVQGIHPYNLLAYVILPEHFHWLMRVNGPGGDFSAVMHSIKRNYTLNYKKAHHVDGSLTLWQERFWDHLIRDEDDLNRHMDYVHYNPVKHGHVLSPGDWAYSTYLHWEQRGYYEPGWGQSCEPESITGMDIE